MEVYRNTLPSFISQNKKTKNYLHKNCILFTFAAQIKKQLLLTMQQILKHKRSRLAHLAVKRHAICMQWFSGFTSV